MWSGNDDKELLDHTPLLLSPGSAAEEAGLLPGDRIVSVNKVDVTTMLHTEVVGSIKAAGQSGSVVMGLVRMLDTEGKREGRGGRGSEGVKEERREGRERERGEGEGGRREREGRRSVGYIYMIVLVRGWAVSEAHAAPTLQCPSNIWLSCCANRATTWEG